MFTLSMTSSLEDKKVSKDRKQIFLHNLVTKITRLCNIYWRHNITFIGQSKSAEQKIVACDLCKL